MAWLPRESDGGSIASKKSFPVLKKVIPLSLSVAAVVAVAVLLVLPRSVKHADSNPRERVNVDLPEGTRPSRVSVEGEGNLLLAIQSRLSSIEARLRALEQQRPAVMPSALPSVPVALPAGPPLNLPDGSDAPWAWIEKLDPGKRVSVEKAFDEAAASARSRMPPPGVAPDDSTLEAAKENLDLELASRLRSILSPQEFEAYLSSLPPSLRIRIDARKSYNQ